MRYKIIDVRMPVQKRGNNLADTEFFDGGRIIEVLRTSGEREILDGKTTQFMSVLVEYPEAGRG